MFYNKTTCFLRRGCFNRHKLLLLFSIISPWCKLLKYFFKSANTEHQSLRSWQESLAVCLVDITSLPECLVSEVTIQNKKGYVSVMYRSPSQSSIEFESFLSCFEDMLSSVLLSKSQFTVILGDFNARSSTWWSNDITNINGTLTESLTTTYGFKHLISHATHILP